jgi:hypothetical protein
LELARCNADGHRLRSGWDPAGEPLTDCFTAPRENVIESSLLSSRAVDLVAAEHATPGVKALAEVLEDSDME